MLGSDWFHKANLNRYCERAGDPAFWGEPLNAISNAAFVLAGLIALAIIWRRPPGQRGVMPAVLSLIVIAIGIGSFLFHTYAEVWAIYADTVPIGVFMLAYLAFALRQYAGWNWLLVGAGLAAFLWSRRWAATVQCRSGLFTDTGGPCLNGTMQYSPALFALVLVGMLLAVLRHPAWKYMLAAAALFGLSMTMRIIDLETCNHIDVAGYHTGTHFLWHTFNGLMLFVLLISAIRHGRRPAHPGA
jgi:hypothetical protein